jgi:hypothetical protein
VADQTDPAAMTFIVNADVVEGFCDGVGGASDVEFKEVHAYLRSL